MDSPGVLAPVRGPFRAIVRAAVPAAARLDDAAWSDLEAVVEAALAERPAAVRRQLVLFIRLLNLLSLVRYGRRLERLEAGRAERFLRSFERFPLLFRRGLWGVRTLAYMGYYSRPDARDAVGYRAALRGWESRGETAGPWPERHGRAPTEPDVMEILPDGPPHE